MFFNKKKPKIDPKIRFQNRQFNQKLQQARTYKRTARVIPEGGWQKFLASIGLGSIWRQIFVLLVVAGIIYLVYIPNFLATQKIIVVGMSQSDTTAVENAINTSIAKVFPWNPQKNLLFLSKRRLSEAVMSVPGADHINEIDKNFKTKTVTISVTSKYERFLVRSSEKVYDVYNDGSVKGVAGVDRNYWEGLINPGMVKVEVAGRIVNDSNKEFLNSATVDYIQEFDKQAKGIVGSSLAYVKITLPEFRQPEQSDENVEPNEGDSDKPAESSENGVDQPLEAEEVAVAVTPPPLVAVSEVNLPLKADELEIFMQKASDPKRLFRVLVDTQESPHDLVQRLNLLLSQTAPDRYNLLAYIDLRVANRAFVCLQGTACNK